MQKGPLAEIDLQNELRSFKERFPKLNNDALFVLWFLCAFLTEDEKKAADALTGVASDKGVDAVLLDEKGKLVIIIQGKYREKVNGKNETHADVTSFADVALRLSGSNRDFDSFIKDAAPQVRDSLKEARRKILQQKYRLSLYYVTLGKCSHSLEKEAISIVNSANCESFIEVFTGTKVLLLLKDYFDGVAPPIASLDLLMESGHGVHSKGILQRYDQKTGIESWVFSMSAQTVAEIYEKTGPRLFARNVRGYLGKTEINLSMAITLEKQPEFFWYYNNGITIICDDAEKRSSSGRDLLHVENPQIINGQQTTRTLAHLNSLDPTASVIVRVIRVQRKADKKNYDYFEKLVTNIVRATNWQNSIRESDLMSNDSRQIEIERALRKLSYLYLRKRQSKSEALSASGANHFFTITKEELAQAVAACDLDPAILRLGKEHLFEDLYNHVFPTADPNYYLNRYWLMKRVGNAAKGYPERAYAKWMIVNFMWSHLRNIIKSKEAAVIFRKQCELKEGSLLVPLEKSANAAFNAVLTFYKKTRGKGATAIDVSSFFRRKGLSEEFQKFWRSSSNKYRSPFNRHYQQFEKSLRKEYLSN